MDFKGINKLYKKRRSVAEILEMVGESVFWFLRFFFGRKIGKRNVGKLVILIMRVELNLDHYLRFLAYHR